MDIEKEASDRERIIQIKKKLEDATTFNRKPPWKWNQPEGFGATICIWGNETDPYSPLVYDVNGFDLADFLTDAPVDIQFLLDYIEQKEA